MWRYSLKMRAVSIDDPATTILGASESIDIVANLDPKTRLGSIVSDALGTSFGGRVLLSNIVLRVEMT